MGLYPGAVAIGTKPADVLTVEVAGVVVVMVVVVEKVVSYATA